MDSRMLAGMGWFRIAVQALVVMVEADGACSSTAIAQELKVHATFLRRALVLPGRANIVVAREGRDGGYRLARPADKVTLCAELLSCALRKTVIPLLIDKAGKPEPARLAFREKIAHRPVARSEQRATGQERL